MKECVVCGRIFEDLSIEINYFNEEYICDECLEEGYSDECNYLPKAI